MVSRHLYSLLVILVFMSVKIYSSEYSVDATSDEEEDISHAFGFEVEVTKKVKYCAKKAEENDMIMFHIEAKVKETDHVFESSYKNTTPYSIQLGQKQVIEAIEKVMFNVCSGDKRRLTLPYAMAFGDETYNTTDGVSIDKNSTLIFDLEIVDVKTPPDISRLFKYLDKEKTGKVEIDALIKKVMKYVGKPGFPIHLPGGQLGELLESTFTSSDKDGDNHLTPEELMTSLGLTAGLPGNQKTETEVNKTTAEGKTDTSGNEDKTETKTQEEDSKTANQGDETKTDDQRKDEL